MLSISLRLHILSQLALIPTQQGQSSRISECLPAWRVALAQKTLSGLTPRAYRRWQLLYSYWFEKQDSLLEHGLKRGHYDALVANQLKKLTPMLAPPDPLDFIDQMISPEETDSRFWACFVSASIPLGSSSSRLPSENIGIAYPLTIRRAATEPRIPPFHLSARVQDAALVAAGGLAIEALGQSLGQRLGMDKVFPLSVDAAFPDEIRLTDESASLAFALATLQEISGIDRPGMAASGVVLRDSGQIQRVQGFDIPYGKLEACFDAGVRELFLPWGTSLQNMPKVGICLDQVSEGHYRYYFSDQPQDDMHVYWLHTLDEALKLLWSDQEVLIKRRLHQQIILKHDLSFHKWEPLFLRIEQDYPEWLAIHFKIYFQYFRDLSELPPNDPQDWLDILRLQSNWVQSWLRYLLNLQANGLWHGQQNPARLWPSFPACVQTDSDLYLLWQAFQEICAIETLGPIPFKQMHQWLRTHQTGWGMLLNQLIQLSQETDIRSIREGLHYNMLRLMELLKSASFMFEDQLWGVLKIQGDEVTGLYYKGLLERVPLKGKIPVPEGGLFLERKKTGTRYNLPFLQLCPKCLELEYFTPLSWAGREEDRAFYLGCEHAPLWLESHQNMASILTSVHQRRKTIETSSLPQQTARLEQPESLQSPADKHSILDQDIQMACIINTELVLDALSTLQDPQQTLDTYHRMVKQLIEWIGADSGDAKQLIVQYGLEANTLIFFTWPERALHFALALHQQVTEYNQQQNLPSTHLQLRTGLSLGPVIRVQETQTRKSRVTGPALQEAQLLARWGKPGHILASASFRDVLSQVSQAHRKLFQLVGTQQRQEAAFERIYAIYTQTTGLRDIPPGFLHPPKQALAASRLQSQHLLERQISLRWLGTWMVEIVDLNEQTLSVQQSWLHQLNGLVNQAMDVIDQTDHFIRIDLQAGCLLVTESHLSQTLLLALELFRLISNNQPDWKIYAAICIGAGELRSVIHQDDMLYGPVRDNVSRVLAFAQPTQLLTEQWTARFLMALTPDFAHSFVEWPIDTSPEDLSLLSYDDPSLGLDVPDSVNLSHQARAKMALSMPDEGKVKQLKKLPSFKNTQKPLPPHLAAYQHHAVFTPQVAAGKYGRLKGSLSLQNHLGMMFQRIESGAYLMGSPASEAERESDERLHRVVISRPFYMQTTPVTQKQWLPVMGNKAIHFFHPDLPVDGATWYEVEAFIHMLNKMGKERYRLPTEAEWEYCCRAGSTEAYCFGAHPSKLLDYAWFSENSAEENESGSAQRVATRLPNNWGLYDMHGNVWEWVSDWYAALPTEEKTNPKGPSKGLEKVIKGGRWASSAGSCRSASRSYLPPAQTNPGGIGFRLVMETFI